MRTVAIDLTDEEVDRLRSYAQGWYTHPVCLEFNEDPANLLCHRIWIALEADQ